MVIWLNGPFGGGKSAVAAALCKRMPNAILYDPEEVGFMLRSLLPDREADFQDLPPWRPLVAATAAEIITYTGQSLITPMSLLRPDYADEIFTAITRHGITLLHIVLHADADTITKRILGDSNHTSGAREFRLMKRADYHHACSTWLSNANQVDTSNLTPDEVADRILGSLPLTAQPAGDPTPQPES